MRATFFLLICLCLAPFAQSWAETASPQSEGIEVRLLGKGKPALFALDKTSQLRVGKTLAADSEKDGVFTGTILTLKPTLTDNGDIAYEGSLQVIDFMGLEPDKDGNMTVLTQSETAPVKGVLGNHQAVAVQLPKLDRTVYFAVDDPARPKKDCAACGPDDKE
ncbi:MAG: hypothetical protein ACQKBW_10950 [Puniceicoccales bacterium]